jgi:hypothetical protein
MRDGIETARERARLTESTKCSSPKPADLARGSGHSEHYRLQQTGTVRSLLAFILRVVEWILARCVIRCVDDVHDLRRDPTHHDLEPLP